MRLRFLRALAAFSVVLGLAACEAPLRPDFGVRIAPLTRSDICADPNDPICASFSSTPYSYNSALGALPPGISDWSLVITQFGGQLDFRGAISAGGSAIADVQNMYVRFFIDNGNNTLGAGDLQVVIRSGASGATMYCGLVTSLPLGSELPSSSPAICENGGVGINEPGRFVYEDFRTADLSAPLWESQGFARLQAGERRALFLVEVGNVITVSGEPALGAATAPATRVDTLAVPSGDNGGGDDDNGGGGDDDGGDDEGDGGGDETGDTTAPSITFSGNAGSYSILAQVNITCVATDVGSGIATSTCPSVNAPAYTFSLGSNTLNASATDNAGNTSVAIELFTVTASSADVCALARSFAKNAGQGNAMCSMLGSGNKAFANHIRAQSGKSLTVEQANTLLRLAAGL